MKIYSDINEFKNVKNPIVTLGTFDGVHYGHQKIINRLKLLAERTNGETVLLTFSPHPRIVLFPDDQDLKLINTMDEKKCLLEKAGIQHLIVHPFTRDFSRISSVNFVRDILINQISTHKLVIGYNHSFGRNREGSFKNLKQLAPVYGFDVEEIPAELIDDISVSSTKIRQAVSSGNINIANNYLGYPYTVQAIVVKGDSLGRKIGFRTANLEVKNSYKIIPKDGVYAVWVISNGQKYKGMMNIGVKPTFSNTSRTLEVHILDFNKDIYGEDVIIEFIERIRDEIAFSNLIELQNQLNIDEKTTIQLLSNK